MTDAEMIKLLRNSPFTFNDIVADRIEQLVKERDAMLRVVTDNHVALQRAEVAEAKLAKAVEALRNVVSAKGLTDPTEYGYDAIKRARAALEELENYNTSIVR